MKPIVWIGNSLHDLRAFPDTAQRAAGYQLGKVQAGDLPDDWPRILHAMTSSDPAARPTAEQLTPLFREAVIAAAGLQQRA